jgi:AcrR family transcriptional regulator
MNSGRIEKRRSEIVGAAIDIFAQKGYHDARISDIAEKLKIGHGTFYRYFKNKRDIFVAVLEGIMQDIGQVVASEDPAQTNSLPEYREQLRRIGQKLFAVLNEYRRGQILFYEVFGVDSELNKRIDLAMDVFDKYTEQYLKNGMKKGFLKPKLDARFISKAINAMLFGAMKDLLASPDPKRRFPRWMDSVELLMLEGMGKHEGESKPRNP